jgi:hypothetical protein
MLDRMTSAGVFLAFLLLVATWGGLVYVMREDTAAPPVIDRVIH